MSTLPENVIMSPRPVSQIYQQRSLICCVFLNSDPGTLIVLKYPYPWRVEEPSIYESVRVHTAIQTGRTVNDLVPNAPSVIFTWKDIKTSNWSKIILHRYNMSNMFTVLPSLWNSLIMQQIIQIISFVRFLVCQQVGERKLGHSRTRKENKQT